MHEWTSRQRIEQFWQTLAMALGDVIITACAWAVIRTPVKRR